MYCKNNKKHRKCYVKNEYFMRKLFLVNTVTLKEDILQFENGMLKKRGDAITS